MVVVYAWDWGPIPLEVCTSEQVMSLPSLCACVSAQPTVSPLREGLVMPSVAKPWGPAMVSVLPSLAVWASVQTTASMLV